MISRLNELVSKVDEITDFEFTSWTAANEIAAYPAFVLDEARESFEKIVSNGHVYKYSLNLDFFILALGHMPETDFESLKSRTVKKLFQVPAYSEIHIAEGQVGYIQIGSHKVLAYHGKIELSKTVYDYDA